MLDTNVVSELRKVNTQRGADANVVAWASTVSTSQLYLSAITLVELETGIMRLDRKDPLQAKALRDWFEFDLLASFSGRILSFDVAAARRCAALHVPNPASDRDAIIAATALSRALTVVTRNTRDFIRSGVRLLNPWEDLAAP